MVAEASDRLKISAATSFASCGLLPQLDPRPVVIIRANKDPAHVVAPDTTGNTTGNTADGCHCAGRLSLSKRLNSISALQNHPLFSYTGARGLWQQHSRGGV